LLRYATSAEEVERAIAEGDDELVQDIEDQLDAVRRQWERDGNYAEESVDQELADLASSDDVVNEVLDLAPEALSGFLEEDTLKSTIRDELERMATQETRRHGTRRAAIYVDSNISSRQGYRAFNIPTIVSWYAPDSLFEDIDNRDFIPEAFAREFWKEMGYGVEWDQTERIEDNTGTSSGDGAHFFISESLLDEMFLDMLREAVSEESNANPKEFVARFLLDLNTQVPGAKRLREYADEQELLEMGRSWFTGDTDQVIEAAEELVAEIQDASSGQQEVILTLDREVLSRLGVRQGVFWENAPWSLVKLRVSDFASEGARMNHCVGRRDMGYAKAALAGEIEIWSLRSRDGKPRFTIEVDSDFYKKGATPEDRGNAITQVKGTGNRLAGFAGKRDENVKFPDELAVWAYIADQLGVDSYAVEDLRHVGLNRAARQIAGNSASRVALATPLRPSSASKS